MSDLLKLNIGCGSRTLDGYVNVDRWPQPGVNKVWNLDVGPWPWESGTVGVIEARDVFEHVEQPILFMTECWRLLVPGGKLRLHTPFFLSPDAFTDPTHRRFPTPQTFDYWIPGRPLYSAHNAAYGRVHFSMCSFQLDQGSMAIELVKLTDEQAEAQAQRPALGPRLDTKTGRLIT